MTLKCSCAGGFYTMKVTVLGHMLNNKLNKCIQYMHRYTELKQTNFQCKKKNKKHTDVEKLLEIVVNFVTEK